ncbi:uncharacterized protein LOC127789846 isoform X3 [Diospyros lotus]|uniref:uncharacterized protein LOC127789846 isoform X3 n=1 Tax=Diospyros lotus TaxID=55363 RepID=UPI00224DCDBB|nr:uncharacterized protein LOC127789846 isoform X3 [Diospyros lotus]
MADVISSSATAFGRQNSPRSIGQKPKRLVTGQAKPRRITWDVCPCPWIQQQFEWESPDLCSSNRWNKVSSFCPISPISLFSSLFLIKILQEFLTRKLHNLPLPNNAIVEIDVYDHQPWFYASGHNYGMDQYETYYFVRREKKSKSKSETAKNPKRHLKSEGNSSCGGWWKAITGDKPIRNKRGRIIGFKKTLKFCTYKDQKYDRRECVKTDWIMHEYKLPHPTFQEWVVCGIRYNGGKGTGQEYASGCHLTLDHASGHRQEREEDQQSQTQQDSPYDKVCNASSQLNMGSDGQCCWANAQEYFGLNEQEYASGCHSTLDHASEHWQEREEDQQSQTQQDSPYDKVCNASSQLNMGSDGQCCWANAQEYFGLNEQEYASGCHSTLDHASGHWQEREEDQQSQTQQDSPYDKVCNASSQLNMGSNGQCCWANAQEYFGLNEQEYASGCHSTLDHASGHWQEREEDQQSQTQQVSPYDKVCNASSQLNMGSDGQCCWENAQEYFGLNEQEYASGCHSTLDNQQARDSNRSLEFIDDPSWNEFEDTEGSQVQFPQISFTETELEDGGLYFDLWT